ncbi:hypothetical protein ACTU6U_10645 [Microbacterium sp. A196]|uniref:hypothetical protein n=1 Tax=unclassified Microbacterium TaxID=2609290 RepID=UPI003FD09CAF
MTPIDVFAIVGEVLSWIGLGVGIPFLIIAGMVALVEGRWERVDMVVIEHDGATVVRWFAGGDFHERALTSRERASDEWHQGYVRVWDPQHVRLHPPMLRRLFLTIGAIFAGAGVVGFIVSMIPAFI